MPAILVTGVVALWSKMASAAPKQPSNVQTATVGDRVYSVIRLGQGNYLISLISKAGVVPIPPVNLTISQTGEMGAVGDANAVAQLRLDMNQFNLNFAA